MCRSSCARPTVPPSCVTPARARRSTRSISTAARCVGSAIPVRRPTSRARGVTWRALGEPRHRRGGRRSPRPGASQPAVPRAAGADGRAPVDAPGRADGRPWTVSTPARVRRRRRRDAARRARARIPRPAGRGVGVPKSSPATGALRGRGGLARARRSDLAAPFGTRTRSRPTRRCSARRRSPTRIAPTSWCAWARRSPARSRRPGSIRRSGRCSSTRTTRGSIRTAPRRSVCRSMPSCCWTQWRLSSQCRNPTRGCRHGWVPSARPARRSIACSTRPVRRAMPRSRATLLQRFPNARRSWSRRACPYARSSGAWRPAPACASSPTAAPTGSTGSCRPSSASRSRALHPRSVFAATCASFTTPTGCSPRRAPPRSSSSTTTAVGSSRTCRRRSYRSSSNSSAHRTASISCRWRAHGAEAERIDDLGKLRAALSSDQLVASRSVRVLVVPVDRQRERGRHQALWDAVDATAVSAVAGSYGRTSARSMGSSLAWVSAHSASGLRAGDDSGPRVEPGPVAVDLRRAARPRTRRRRGRRPSPRVPRRDRAASARARGSPSAAPAASRRPRVWGAARVRGRRPRSSRSRTPRRDGGGQVRDGR